MPCSIPNCSLQTQPRSCGGCAKHFHLACLNLDLESAGPASASWRCPECVVANEPPRRTSRASSTSRRTSSTSRRTSRAKSVTPSLPSELRDDMDLAAAHVNAAGPAQARTHRAPLGSPGLARADHFPIATTATRHHAPHTGLLGAAPGPAPSSYPPVLDAHRNGAYIGGHYGFDRGYHPAGGHAGHYGHPPGFGPSGPGPSGRGRQEYAPPVEHYIGSAHDSHARNRPARRVYREPESDSEGSSGYESVASHHRHRRARRERRDLRRLHGRTVGHTIEGMEIFLPHVVAGTTVAVPHRNRKEWTYALTLAGSYSKGLPLNHPSNLSFFDPLKHKSMIEEYHCLATATDLLALNGDVEAAMEVITTRMQALRVAVAKGWAAARHVETDTRVLQDDGINPILLSRATKSHTLHEKLYKKAPAKNPTDKTTPGDSSTVPATAPRSGHASGGRQGAHQ